MMSMPTTVRPAERIWVRLSVGVMAVAALTYGIFSTAGRVNTQIYLAAMIVLLLVVLGVLARYRHAGIAREARTRSTGAGESASILFERAIMFGHAPDEIRFAVGKGWIALTPDGIDIWETGNPTPVARYSRSGTSVESVGGDPFVRPIARFRFGDESRFDVVVVRDGFADLTGWSASQIRSLNREIVSTS